MSKLVITAVCASLAFGAADALSIDWTAKNTPDINVSNNSTVSYDAATDNLTVTPLFPITGLNLITLGDGSQRAASELALTIDVFIDGLDTSTPATVLSGGAGLSITGNLLFGNDLSSGVALSGTLLTGTLAEAGNDVQTIELGWTVTGGLLAEEFGATAITLLSGTTFDTASGFGANFGDQSAFSAVIDTAGVAEIPIGPAFPLLLSGLAALSWIRRSGRA